MIENLKRLIARHSYKILFAAIFTVYAFNLFIDVMEIDAAQYALISMEMSMTKSFLEVYQQGQDYLDKPPLLFWLSSLSMLVLGISNVAYKLPSVLIAILGIYSTYRFTKDWYNKNKALLAALILGSCQALFLMTNDVRTDTNLLGLTMFSIWQLSNYIRSNEWKYLILASIGIGGAMMAKGPIALIIPAAAFGTDFLLKRQWRNIFKPQWIVMLVLIGITLLPMCYGLYTQFDLHPEKTVYNLEGPSGLRFFFWTQSFGRITGENYWSNNAGPFYFFHTILWDFQPWVLMFIPALFLRIRKMVIDKFKASEKGEYITLGGFVLVLIALSMSSYKLPHYIFVLFPFASIITADFIYQLKDKWQSRVSKIQFGIMHIFWLGIATNFMFVFPSHNILFPLLFIVLFTINWLVFRELKNKSARIFIPTIITAVSFNLMMATIFYPNLLTYQATSQAGRFVVKHHIPLNKFYHLERSSFSLDFYAKRITPEVPGLKDIPKGSWIYTDEECYQHLLKENAPIKLVKAFPRFKVTALKVPFLNKDTREEVLQKEYLVEVE